MTNKNNKKGFTIIEVVLVLAIAGLIFLMVFIALPALQRSQRNTRRRQDMARILSAFNDYQANNNGKMPESQNDLDKLAKRYISGNSDSSKSAATANNVTCENSLGDQFCDPDGTSYWFGFDKDDVGAVDKSSATFDHKIYYITDATCNGTKEGETGDGNGAREIAIMYVLEGGSIYCGDNQ